MSEIIDKTIEVLERDGWCRLAETNDEGQHCLIGALRLAEIELSLDCTAADHAENTLQLLLREQTGVPVSPMNWNDACAKNVDDVIHLLKLAGEELDLQVTR